MDDDLIEINAPPVIGPLSEGAVQISGRSFVPRSAKTLPMLKEDREWLKANGWIETPDGWKKCLR